MVAKVSIISLGRLGRCLYHKLDHAVGSYFSTSKGLENEVKYDFRYDSIPDELQNSDILIFNLTPSAIERVDFFKNFLSKVKTNKFIFISSVSVYGPQGEVDENTETQPTTASGKLLKECEEAVFHSNLAFTLIRSAGIYSDSSHPGNSLSGREVKINGKTSVNLIHLNELTDVIIKSFDFDYRIINAVNVSHPTKEEYYTQYCIEKGIEVPFFEKDEVLEDKVIKTIYADFEIKSSLP